MYITKIAAAALIGAVLAVLLKERSPVFSAMVSVITALVIFIFLLPQFNEIVVALNGISQYINIDTKYIGVLIKSVIIAYIAMFSSQLCRDFNQAAIGDKVELAAKISIMALTVPLITELVRTVLYIF